jgi:hypothetical protein
MAIGTVSSHSTDDTITSLKTAVEKVNLQLSFLSQTLSPGAYSAILALINFAELNMAQAGGDINPQTNEVI